MIKEIRLERFKKFATLSVQLSPFSVLMGENSSGKTSVLQALNLALVTLNTSDLVSVTNQDEVRIRKKGIGLTKLPGIELSDFRELYYAKRSRASATEKWVGASVALVDDRENTYKLQVTSLFGGFNIKCVSDPADFKSPPTLQDKPPLLISGFVGLSPVEERVLPVALVDRLRSGHVSSAIRNFVYDTQANVKDKYESLINRLARDFDFHLDSVLFDDEKDLYVTARYREACDKKRLSLDFNASGSGFMQILQILAPIYRYCPDRADVVLLDEPDAHLHPNLQTTLANSLRRIREELGIQIIISTHSSSIIRSASPTEVIPISAHANICRPLTTSKEIEEHVKSTIDSYDWAKSVISGKLVFFEDSDVSLWEELDDILDTKVFKGASTVPLICGRGKTDRVPFQVREVLAEVVSNDIDIIFVRDGDGLPPEWRDRLIEYASKRRVMLRILEHYELESYLLRPDIFESALRRKFPALDIPTRADIEQRIVRALKDTISLSKYHYDNALEEELYQAAHLMNLSEYRDLQRVKSEVRNWHDHLETLMDLEDLRKYGQGKEGLAIVLRWLNDEEKLNLGRSDLTAALADVPCPAELVGIMGLLRSKDTREDPELLPETPVFHEQEDIEERIENLFLGFED